MKTFCSVLILFLALFGGYFWQQEKAHPPVSSEASGSDSTGKPGELESISIEPAVVANSEGKSPAIKTGIRPLGEIPIVEMRELNPDELHEKAAEIDAKRGNGVFRFAEPIDVEVTTANSGIWEELPDGQSIWRTRIVSEGAESLNLGFHEYTMPKGGRLSIFPSDRANERPIRDFTHLDNEDHGQLWTPIFHTDDLALEVILPAGQRDLLALTLSKVNHGFRNAKSPKIGGDTSGSCNIDVACTSDPTVGPLVSMFANQIRAVGAYTLNGFDTCSGALLNNTANDGTPYFLTAEHCGISPSNAPSMVVYFNFENSTCRTPGSGASGGVGDGDLSQFSSGTIHRAEDAASDFCLVELDDPIPSSYNVFFAGWDRSGGNGMAVGIHHPAVAEKRISFDLDDTVNDGATHVQVLDWDHGTTEGGSSGSPLFDFNGRIIGDLTGGDAACGNDLYDTYGRVSVSWAGAGTSSTRLSDWLDPIGAGSIAIDGINQDDTLSINDVEITEGDTGTSILTFTVTLARTANDTVTVQYQTFNNIAAAGSDFQTTNGTLIFNPGDSEETVAVTINGDSTPEDDETFEVRLSNPTNAIVGDGTGVGTILNDDFISPVITSPFSSSGFEGDPFSYTITATNTPTSYSIQNEPPGMTVNAASGKIAWTPQSTGQFTVTIVATNPSGSGNQNLTINVSGSPLREALDSTLNFTGETLKWLFQTEVTHDGVDAAKNVLLAHNESAFFEAEIPVSPAGGTASFWWKVSSEPSWDFLRFLHNGSLVAEISGEQDWAQISFPLPANGTSTLRWEYSKDGSVSEGDDAGFIDELEIILNEQLPAPTGLDLTSGSDTGDSQNDDLTNDTTPTITGSADPGSTVNLSTPGGVVGAGIADPGGNWSITTLILPEGSQSLTATASESGSNESVPSAPIFVTIDSTAPTVTIEQAAGQADPATSGPFLFTATFSEAVSSFAAGDLSITGSAAGTASISGGPTIYSVSITDSGTEGLVSASVPGLVVSDSAGNSNEASSSFDNRVALDLHGSTPGTPTPVAINSGVGSLSAFLHTGDIDTFSFTLAEARIITVSTTGSANTRGILRDSIDAIRNNPDLEDDSGIDQNFLSTVALTAGTYTVAVSNNSGEADYTFHIDALETPSVQPDISLGGTLGDDIYDTQVGQTLVLTSRRARAQNTVVFIENDGEIPDSFSVSASPGNSLFKVAYSHPIEGNITATLLTGTHTTPVTNPGESADAIFVQINPNRQKLRKKKIIRRNGRRIKRTVFLRRSFALQFSASSMELDTQRDIGLIRIKTK
ncbi:MAG: Ig-like domain-containing protein [Verrucomicrobiales bacterium]|nr:Ig-like domain-containing protein [Verrucomicrobiales bacterium]